MNRKAWSILVGSALLVVAVACSKNSPAQKVVVEIPSGFNGDFLLEMGVRGAPPLVKQDDTYVVAVPRSGKAITSTLLTDSQPSFRNSSDGAVWGY
jgi:hypothetical protein